MGACYLLAVVEQSCIHLNCENMHSSASNSYVPINAGVQINSELSVLQTHLTQIESRLN